MSESTVLTRIRRIVKLIGLLQGSQGYNAPALAGPTYESLVHRHIALAIGIQVRGGGRSARA